MSLTLQEFDKVLREYSRDANTAPYDVIIRTILVSKNVCISFTLGDVRYLLMNRYAAIKLGKICEQDVLGLYSSLYNVPEIQDDELAQRILDAYNQSLE